MPLLLVAAGHLADRAGVHAGAGAAQHGRSRETGRRAGISPVLGARAPRDARGRRLPAPAVLVGQLANATRHLRVGAGGVLLPDPRRSWWPSSSARWPRSTPGGSISEWARHRAGPGMRWALVRPESERTAKPFDRQLGELQGFLRAAGDAPVKAIPVLGGNVPELWLLGSSAASAELAGTLGLPYAFAHHLNPGEAGRGTACLPGKVPPVGAHHHTDNTGQRVRHRRRDRRTGRVARRVDAVEGAQPDARQPHPAAESRRRRTSKATPIDDRATIATRSGRVLAGGPETVTKLLSQVLDETGTGELMVTTPAVVPGADRRRSYETGVVALAAQL